MEIKAELKLPYTDIERCDFIVEQNHQLGYEIRETETALEAWGYTEEEKQEQERERLDNLSMTRGDVFEALILARGLTKPQIRAMISGNAYIDLTTKATDNIKTLGMGDFGSGTVGLCALLCVGFATVTT